MKFNKFCHVVITVLYKAQARTLHSTKFAVLSPDTYNEHKKVCPIDFEFEGKDPQSTAQVNGGTNQTHYFNGADNIDAINGRRKLKDIL
jgi:hypothetical protein